MLAAGAVGPAVGGRLTAIIRPLGLLQAPNSVMKQSSRKQCSFPSPVLLVFMCLLDF